MVCDELPSVQAVTGFHTELALTALEAAHLTEHVLLLNEIFFFSYELKMSGQSEHPPSCCDPEPCFVWWVTLGLCPLSAIVLWSESSVLTLIRWVRIKYLTPLKESVVSSLTEDL